MYDITCNEVTNFRAAVIVPMGLGELTQLRSLAIVPTRSAGSGTGACGELGGGYSVRGSFRGHGLASGYHTWRPMQPDAWRRAVGAARREAAALAAAAGLVAGADSGDGALYGKYDSGSDDEGGVELDVLEGLDAVACGVGGGAGGAGLRGRGSIPTGVLRAAVALAAAEAEMRRTSSYGGGGAVSRAVDGGVPGLPPQLQEEDILPPPRSLHQARGGKTGTDMSSAAAAAAAREEWGDGSAGGYGQVQRDTDACALPYYAVAGRTPGLPPLIRSAADGGSGGGGLDPGGFREENLRLRFRDEVCYVMRSAPSKGGVSTAWGRVYGTELISSQWGKARGAWTYSSEQIR